MYFHRLLPKNMDLIPAILNFDAGWSIPRCISFWWIRVSSEMITLIMQFFSSIWFFSMSVCSALPPSGKNLDTNWRGNTFVCKNKKKYFFIKWRLPPLLLVLFFCSLIKYFSVSTCITYFNSRYTRYKFQKIYFNSVLTSNKNYFLFFI